MDMMRGILAPGQPAPWFEAWTCHNPQFRFHTVAGKKSLLIFSGMADLSKENTVKSISCLLTEAKSHDCTIFLITNRQTADVLDYLIILPTNVVVFSDPDSSIHQQFGIHTDAPIVNNFICFVLDARLTIRAVRQFGTEPHHTAAQIRPLLQALQQESAQFTIQAPVLVLPGIFEPALCRTLIQSYQQHGGELSGFMREQQGKTVLMQDPRHKIHRDHTLHDPKLIQLCLQRIRLNLLPQLQRAFQFQATRIERYLVACYHSEQGGHFRPHRDNTTPGTAHRRFAVSINLNTCEYQGGDLRFPEFGQQLYKAPTGGAVVFSCSLLHEATPVTQGERYVFLPFLYDEAAALVREKNAGSFKV
ncbi:MAG: 2OG-Fe(II) oxygenase [Marinospirillum sp.]|uniref:2OG-Fe(II) oxygenase n=1 Tax=Marinospirillum sp. TaxID=2183934 RepID=UPI001A0D6256|nr:2OG-Fe(II) oxygenase [Marinospirillum sp.]MBE0508054.1 2OG-Fe(II) oxygenase [Marinospirillum sp.]